MNKAKTASSGEPTEEKRLSTARVVERQELLHTITIECPVDFQQFNVDEGTKEFLCPIHNGSLVIENLV